MNSRSHGADLSLCIDEIAAWHIKLGGSGYWESYVSRQQGGRFFFRPGWHTVYAHSVETIVVRVRLSDGTVGWGEANAPIAPEITGLLVTRLLARMLEARTFESPFALWDFAYDAQRGRGHGGGYYLDALAAVDIAVWDALGRRAGLPVAALLSAEPRQSIPAYLSGIRRPTLDQRIDHARSWAARGLTGIKLFLDADTAAGARELEAIRAAVPEIEQWMVDVLWSLADLEAATVAKRAYGDAGARWLECPLPPEDLAGHVALRSRPGAAIALGEHFHTHFESTPWLAQGALDVFQPDVGRTGLSGFRRQADLARQHGVPTTPHMGSGLDIFQAATLQAAATSDPDILCEYQAGLEGRLGDAVQTDWHFMDGGFALPERPGLGIEVDEAALGIIAVSIAD